MGRQMRGFFQMLEAAASPLASAQNTTARCDVYNAAIMVHGTYHRYRQCSLPEASDGISALHALYRHALTQL